MAGQVSNTTLQVRFVVDGDGRVKVAFADMAAGADTSSKAAQRLAAELLSLTERVDQNAAAVNRLARDQAVLDAALSKGLITQAQHSRLMQQSVEHYDSVGRKLSDTEKAAYNFGRNVGGAIKQAVFQFAAFAGAGLSLNAVMGTLKRSIDLSDETRDLSIRLGVSTEAISKFRYAAEQTGTDMDALGLAMKILAKNAADALNPTSRQAKIFQALGISVVDASGHLKQQDQLLPEIADKWKQLNDGTTKAALAQALFGRSALQITEFLDLGSHGLKEMGDRAAQLGVVINGQTAAAADNFNDKLNDLKQGVTGLALKVAEDLMPDLGSLEDWALGFATDGQKSAETAHSIANGIREIADAIRELGQLFGILQSVHDFFESSDRLAQNVGRSLGVSFIGDKLRETFPSLYKPLVGGPKPEKQVNGAPDNLFQIPGLQSQFNFAQTPGSFSFVPAKTAGGGVDDRKVALALANPRGAGGALGGDAAQEAEKIKAALESMTSAEKDWEAQLEKSGNPILAEYNERLRKISDEAFRFAKAGVPADKIAAFTARMKELAAQLRDEALTKFQKDFTDRTNEMAASMQGPVASALARYRVDVDELDKQLGVGLITLDQYNARLAVYQHLRDQPGDQMIKDLHQQLDLLGATNEQQDLYNRLAYLGVSANSALGQSIGVMVHQLHEQGKAVSDQVAAMDGLRDSTRGFFTDLMHGVGIWNALKKAADNFAARIEEIIANRATERLFGEQGSADDGKSGGRISGFFGSLFGVDKKGGGGDSAAALSGAAGQIAASATPLYGAAAALETAAAALAAAGGGQGGGFGGGWLGTLFSAFGSGWGSDSGGGAMADTGGYGSWAGAIAAAFGGGRATGGTAEAGRFYRVNENRPELLELGGSLFLMMGGRNGRVLSRDQEERYAGGGRGDTNIHVTVPVTGRVDRRTRTQIGANTALEIRQQLASVQ